MKIQIFETDITLDNITVDCSIDHKRQFKVIEHTDFEIYLENNGHLSDLYDTVRNGEHQQEEVSSSYFDFVYRNRNKELALKGFIEEQLKDSIYQPLSC